MPAFSIGKVAEWARCEETSIERVSMETPEARGKRFSSQRKLAIRKGGRVVEGTALEKRHTGNGIESSNLSLSAMLKLIALNVERSRHLSRNLPFFLAERPDVLCLQEAFEADLERFQRELDMPFLVWQPDVFIYKETNSTGKPGFSGQAILSRHPLTATGEEYYYMPEHGIALEMKQVADVRSTNAQGVIWASIKKDGATYTIANTHFTWTPDGHPNASQETDFISLKAILSGLPPHVLVGDLNAPRGRGVWEKFAALYERDNIPLEVDSTVDPDWHRFPHLTHVVDCLFTGEGYQAKGVRVVSGVSDHRAIAAEIGR